jgi:hypothetical protein
MNLCWLKIKKTSIVGFMEHVNIKSLTHLWLFRCKITDDEFAHLAHANLEQLTVWNCTLTAKSLDVVATMSLRCLRWNGPIDDSLSRVTASELTIKSNHPRLFEIVSKINLKKLDVTTKVVDTYPRLLNSLSALELDCSLITPRTLLTIQKCQLDNLTICMETAIDISSVPLNVIELDLSSVVGDLSRFALMKRLRRVYIGDATPGQLELIGTHTDAEVE